MNYVTRHLDPNAHPVLFNGDVRADPSGSSAPDAFQRYQTAYAAIGVRYLVTSADGMVSGMPLVFQGATSRIYEVPAPASYFSAADCTLLVHTRTSLTTICEAPSHLMRLELAMPGWQARIGGVGSPIVTSGEIFQSVALPAGRSDIVFRFEPPYMIWGYAGLGLGTALLLLILWPHGKASRGCREAGAEASSG